MPQRFQTMCREPGCCKLHRNRGGYCDTHTKYNVVANEARKRELQRKKDDPVWNLYNCADWRNYCKAFKSCGNVICQRIWNGVRCTREVEAIHHLISGRDRPDLFYTMSNTVGLCRQCHPNTRNGDPNPPETWKEIYAPTKVPHFSF